MVNDYFILHDAGMQDKQRELGPKPGIGCNPRRAEFETKGPKAVVQDDAGTPRRGPPPRGQPASAPPRTWREAQVPHPWRRLELEVSQVGHDQGVHRRYCCSTTCSTIRSTTAAAAQQLQLHAAGVDLLVAHASLERGKVEAGAGDEEGLQLKRSLQGARSRGQRVQPDVVQVVLSAHRLHQPGRGDSWGMETRGGCHH